MHVYWLGFSHIFPHHADGIRTAFLHFVLVVLCYEVKGFAENAHDFYQAVFLFGMYFWLFLVIHQIAFQMR